MASSRDDDQRVLLRASKLLHHVLARQRLPRRPESFLIHQPHRTPARRVLRATTTVMRPFARTRISRRAGIQRAVRVEALLGLRDELDDMLGRIRSTRHISNPVFKCPACGHIGRGADPHVSVRSTILALARFGVAARERARALEKAWSIHRKTSGLDLYGQAATSEPARLPGCAHVDER